MLSRCSQLSKRSEPAMCIPMRAGRFRRSMLTLALLAAGILGAAGVTAPANAQYPYPYNPYYAYYYPGYYPYYYPYAAPYYAAPVIGAGLALGAWDWGWGRPWGW